MILGEEETFECMDCKERHNGKEMRIVHVNKQEERYLCGTCAVKHDTFRCRLVNLTYLCPKCGETHDLDLGRLLLLEVTNREKYDSSAMVWLPCGHYSIDIKGNLTLILKTGN